MLYFTLCNVVLLIFSTEVVILLKCLKQFFTRYFKRNEFISAKKYNKLVKTEEGNCLSFAFGITQKSLINFDILTLDQIIKIQTYGELLEEVSICDQFTEKARLLGYKVKQVNNLSGLEIIHISFIL